MGKQLALLKEAQPHISRVAVRMNPVHSMASPIKGEMECAARMLGVQPQLLDVRGADEVEHALAALTREPANALIVPPFPILLAQR
jgi:putative tryptophan/tyrosine transport system substrate-binding protein